LAGRRYVRRRGKFTVKIPKRFFGRVFRIFSILTPYAVAIGFAAILLAASYWFAIKSDLFSLKKISIVNGSELKGEEAFLATGLRDKQSILTVDIHSIEKRIRHRYPEYKDVQVRRILPNEIKVILKKREAIAQLEQDKYYLVDADAVVISGGLIHKLDELPVIRGARISQSDLVLGAILDRRIFGHVIRLLDSANKIKKLTKKVTSMDIADRHNYIMWLDEAIEVRISSKQFGEQLRKLSDALNGIDLDPRKIKYIDLRFDDVIIGPR
jgi:cell division septal protein FtsQ